MSLMWNTLPKWSILSQEVLGSGLRLPNSAGYGGVALYHHTLRRYDLLLSDLAFLGVLLRAWGTLCASTPNRTSDSPSLDGRTQPRGHRAPDLQTSGTGGPGRSGGLRFDDLLQELSEVPNLDPRGMEPNPVQLPPAHPQQGQLRHMPPPHMANMPGGGCEHGGAANADEAGAADATCSKLATLSGKSTSWGLYMSMAGC